MGTLSYHDDRSILGAAQIALAAKLLLVALRKPDIVGSTLSFSAQCTDVCVVDKLDLGQRMIQGFF
jgi:hypothetical protein